MRTYTGWQEDVLFDLAWVEDQVERLARELPKRQNGGIAMTGSGMDPELDRCVVCGDVGHPDRPLVRVEDEISYPGVPESEMYGHPDCTFEREEA